jgi:hypothetical protein
MRCASDWTRASIGNVDVRNAGAPASPVKLACNSRNRDTVTMMIARSFLLRSFLRHTCS